MRKLLYSIAFAALCVFFFFGTVGVNAEEGAEIKKIYTLQAKQSETEISDKITVDGIEYVLREKKLLSEKKETVELSDVSEDMIKASAEELELVNVKFDKYLRQPKTTSKEFYNYFKRDIPKDIELDGKRYETASISNLGRELPFSIDIDFFGEKDCLYYQYGDVDITIIDLEGRELISYTDDVLSKINIPKEYYKVSDFIFSSEYDEIKRSRRATLTGTQSANWIVEYKEVISPQDAYIYTCVGDKIISTEYEVIYSKIATVESDKQESKSDNNNNNLLYSGIAASLVLAIAVALLLLKFRKKGKDE